MNVYDFDGTIYDSNCTAQFLLYSLLRHPGILFSYAPKAVCAFLKYKTGKQTRDDAAAVCLSFPAYLHDFDKLIRRFWDKKESHISAWYLKQKKANDIIISASPECIVKPMADRLGVTVVGSRLNFETRKMEGPCMYGRAKARFIIHSGIFLDHVVDEFYSDSVYDAPLALCAEKAFLVTNHAKTCIPWPKLSEIVKSEKGFHRKLFNETYKKDHIHIQ